MKFFCLLVFCFPALAQAEGLRDIAERNGITYGCAVTSQDLQNDPAFAQAVAKECATITPINDFKMSFTLTPAGTFDFSHGDFMAAFAKEHGLGLRLHSLEWYKHIPPVVRSLSWWDLFVWLTGYSITVSAHYPQLLSIDCVNEPLARDLPFGERNFWFDALSTPQYSDYPPLAAPIWGAKWGNPHALLLMSDWGLEDDIQKQAEFLSLVKRAMAWGIPVGGIGIQSHLWRPVNRWRFLAFVQYIHELGLEAVVSELTVQSDDERQAAEILRSYVRLARQAGITQITTWGLSSRYTKNSWVWSMPLDGQLQHSAAWQAIAGGLQ